MILIVDDEAAFLHILQTVLQRAGYDTRTAFNALQAVERIQHEMPDLIILDDMMPGMTGGDLCAKLKAERDTQTIPVLMYSAGVRLQDPKTQLQVGAQAYISKTTRPRDVVEIVARFVQAPPSSHAEGGG